MTRILAIVLILGSAPPVPAGAEQTRTFPEGYWQRTQVVQDPCLIRFESLVVHMKTKDAKAGVETIKEFLKKRKATIDGSDCDEKRRKSWGSNFKQSGDINAWMPEDALPELQTMILRMGTLEQWNKNAHGYGTSYDPNSYDKWEILTAELKENHGKLEKAPHIAALAESEVAKFAPLAEFGRTIKGKARISIKVE